ncbi:MAG: hypothetical protein H0X65_12590 [Gemmatimonadetes bacterium]|nr:hypothetical protein [Gemmatimonadota bacterium]
MSVLLTAERAAELVEMPKRLVKATELSWHFVPAPVPMGKQRPGKKKPRFQNAYSMKAHLIEVNGRTRFLLTGNKNGSFSFTLTWGDYPIARIDCGARHRLPREPGEPDRFVYGPHVHYYVPGYGLEHAYATTEYSYGDANAALSFFLRHCNVVNPPPVQEVLGLR